MTQADEPELKLVALIDPATRVIQTYGFGLLDPGGIPLDPSQLARLMEPGTKTLNEDGSVTVTPPPPLPPPPAPPPGPNIEALVNALLQAPELSQATKDQLIAGLTGDPNAPPPPA